MTRNLVKPTTALARKSTTSRRIQNPGATKLRKQADKVVGTKSKKIANALAEQAIGGNASSAKLLVELADGANWTEHTDSVATVMSLALNEWKKEPPTIELQTTPNPPKLPLPEQRQLTDGNPQPDS